MYEIKTEDGYGAFSSDKEMFDFNNYSTKSKHCDNSDKLVIVKLKDEIAIEKLVIVKLKDEIAIEKFVGLKPKMYSVLLSK